MTHQELIDHKNTLNGKIKHISKTIEYFKSIGVTSLINTLEDTRDFLIQSVYIINTELYKKEDEKMTFAVVSLLFIGSTLLGAAKFLTWLEEGGY